jgi:quinol monooxygenase YgiN
VIVVAGALFVDRSARPAYLESCRRVVELARETPGCLDVALSADLLDDRRINVYERWTDDEALQRFRGSGPSGDQQAAIESADVQEFRVSGG